MQLKISRMHRKVNDAIIVVTALVPALAAACAKRKTCNKRYPVLHCRLAYACHPGLVPGSPLVNVILKSGALKDPVRFRLTL